MPFALEGKTDVDETRVDSYEGFVPVQTPAEVMGRENRIYRGPVEEPILAPKPTFLKGQPDIPFRAVRMPIQLRLAKVAHALHLRRKLIVNTENSKLLLDSLRKTMVDTDAVLDNETLAALDPGKIAAAKSEAQRVAGVTLCVSTRHGGFGHFLLEGLSQLWAARHLDMRKVKVLIDSVPDDFNAPFLESFGVKPENVVRFAGRPMLFERLIVATQACILPRKISSAFWDVAGLVADHNRVDDPRRRLYVSRAYASKRRLLNESAVQKEFRDRGFEAVYPETLSAPDQLRLFAEAEWIAGPVGSGMFNAVFSPRSVKRIILAPSNFFTPNDMLISRDEAPMYFFSPVDGHSRKDPASADWTADLEGLREALRATFG